MRQLETSTLSNQNITTALLCHTYTADADRAIFFRLFVDQAAGSGDYIAHLTIQRLGAGSAYESIKTTKTAAAGVTAICLTTIAIPLKSTDVCKIYLIGLAGDTTTPDIVTEVWETNYLKPTTADRTLDVAATGEAGLDFDNVKAATAPTTLTNITVPAVTTVGSVTGAVGSVTGNVTGSVGSVAAGGITAASIANGAIDSATFALGAIDEDAIAASACYEIADKVWDETIADHVGAGSTGATLNGLAPGAATTLNAEITEIHIS